MWKKLIYKVIIKKKKKNIVDSQFGSRDPSSEVQSKQSRGDLDAGRLCQVGLGPDWSSANKRQVFFFHYYMYLYGVLITRELHVKTIFLRKKKTVVWYYILLVCYYCVYVYKKDECISHAAMRNLFEAWQVDKKKEKQDTHRCLVSSSGASNLGAHACVCVVRAE